MNEFDKINEALNLKVAAEVERRAKEWLTAAMGADWTALYEAEIRTVGRLRGELNEAYLALESALSDLRRIEEADWTAEQMRLGAKSGAHRVRAALGNRPVGTKP